MIRKTVVDALTCRQWQDSVLTREGIGEKLLERSFDQSLESKLHQTICDLREENKLLSKRNNKNDRKETQNLQ